MLIFVLFQDFIEQSKQNQRFRATTMGMEAQHPGITSNMLPVVFRWEGGGKNVYLSGSFNNWRTKIPMNKRWVYWSTKVSVCMCVWRKEISLPFIPNMAAVQRKDFLFNFDGTFSFSWQLRAHIYLFIYLLECCNIV